MRTTLTMMAAALLLATPALAEPWDFILTNDTGRVIKSVELSPAGAGAWEAHSFDTDDPGRSPRIAVGGRRTIQFDKAEDMCRYDLRATFADDSVAIFAGINVCDNPYVTIRYANGTPSFTGD